MSRPSTTPRGERAGQPGARWETVIQPTGEQHVLDGQPQPRANRATRRAARKKRAH